MARTADVLPEGVRITDHISLGVVARAFPKEKVEAALNECGKAGRRRRDLPAQVVVYYVIALALYMNVSSREVLRCLLEGVKWVLGPDARVRVAGKSGISQARRRLGSDVMERLHDSVVGPVAVRGKCSSTRTSFGTL